MKVIAFDARAAKLLKPGEHLKFAEAPGLRLEISATRRTWTYRYKSPIDGRMRQTRLGHWPAMSVAAALAAWEALRAARDAGADPAADARQARRAAHAAAVRRRTSSPKVRELCAAYLAQLHGNVTAKTHAEMERTLATMLGELAGATAATVTRAQAYDLIERYRATPVQARKLRQMLGATWDFGLDSARLPADTPNWWRLVLRGKLASRGKRIAGKHVGAGKRVLTAVEVGQLIRWLPHFTRLHDDVLTLYLWTGCRGAEITAMHAGEISTEPDGLWWTIPRHKLKMARSARTVDLRVPLVGRAERIVLRRLEAHPGSYLFPAGANRKRPGSRSPHVTQRPVGVAVHYHQPYSRTRPEDVRPRLPVTHWSPHDLRRTARTLLTALGCPSDVAEAILGHAQPGIEGVYNLHGYDAERRRWLTRLAEHLEQLAAQPAA